MWPNFHFTAFIGRSHAAGETCSATFSQIGSGRHTQQLVIDTYFDWYWLVTCGSSFKWYTHLTEPATYQGRSPMGAHSVTCQWWGTAVFEFWPFLGPNVVQNNLLYWNFSSSILFYWRYSQKMSTIFFHSLKRSSRFFIPKNVQQNPSCTTIPDSFLNAAPIFGAS